MATVTICAPLASTAARVSSKSLYLPVPTSRRDEYDLPAMTSCSIGLPLRITTIDHESFTSGGLQSAPAHRNHELQSIAVDELLCAELSARHDLAITLHCNAFAGELQLLDQLGDGERILEAAPLAVDGERDHAMCSGR